MDAINYGTSKNHSTTMEVSRDTSEILAGKLHKRRDFFTKQWRSRHFVLDKSAGMLVYRMW